MSTDHGEGASGLAQVSIDLEVKHKCKRALYFFPIAKATMVEPFLVRKYLPPGVQMGPQSSRSYYSGE